MSNVPLNPYAPPGPEVVAAPPTSTLPAGFYRFRLDPVASGAWTRRMLWVVGLVLGCVAVVTLLVTAGPGNPLVTVLPVVFVLFFVFAVGSARAQKGIPAALTYEVVMGPRVLRRTLLGWIPAEILRPEVTRIVETQHGLWLSSTTPPRALLVSRFLDGYADVRATVAQWCTIEARTGWAGWRLSVASERLQAQRDAILGTSLATDASLRDELEAARLASSALQSSQPIARRRGFWRVLALWVALIVMFLAIWQFLSPTQESRPAPRRVAPSTQE